MSTVGAEIPVPAVAPMLPQPWRVVRAWRETHDTVSLQLVPVRGDPPEALPGQFNMLYAFGVGEAAISISRMLSDGVVHTIREVGAISRALARLQAGDTVGVRGPFGSAWPLAQARGGDVLLVAGGLGLAPLRPALDAVLGKRGDFGRVSLLLGCRHPQDMTFAQELHALGARDDLQILLTVDHAEPDWTGHVGVVPMLIPRASFDPSRTVAMVCGPEVMMRFSADALRAAGVPTERIFLSMERNMRCAIAQCGHCQFGPHFVCRDGPVFGLDAMGDLLAIAEI